MRNKTDLLVLFRLSFYSDFAMLSNDKKTVSRRTAVQRKIHMQDQVRNRVAEIMEDGLSVCVTVLGMKVLVVSAFLLVGVVW